MSEGKAGNQTQKLLALCQEVSVFHTDEQVAYASLPVKGHKEICPIQGLTFSRWLRRQYYLTHQSAPSDIALESAIATMATKATVDGEKRQVFLRVGRMNGKIYVDLCNDEWEVVEISAEGWKILKESPVAFRRSQRMRPLPKPAISPSPGEDIAKLYRFINVNSIEDFRLLVAFILNCFQPDGPFLVLVLYGGQGTAKSTTVRVIRALTDPAEPPLRRMPSKGDDLMVSAQHNWVVAVDNVSHLSEEISDDFCCLATGGGLSKRAHYTNDEEFVLEAKRPIVLNGIAEFVTRGDLTSRSIGINLPPIEKGNRRTEADFWKEFSPLQPVLLGAIFAAISAALKNADAPRLKDDLRMMDAWQFVTGAEEAFKWSHETCVRAFLANQERAHDVVIGASVISPMIETLADLTWKGSPTELWNFFQNWRNTGTHHDKGYPNSVQGLGNQIRRLAQSFLARGITIEEGRTAGTGSTRYIEFGRVPKEPVAPVAKSRPEANPLEFLNL